MSKTIGVRMVCVVELENGSKMRADDNSRWEGKAVGEREGWALGTHLFATRGRRRTVSVVKRDGRQVRYLRQTDVRRIERIAGGCGRGGGCSGGLEEHASGR